MSNIQRVINFATSSTVEQVKNDVKFFDLDFESLCIKELYVEVEYLYGSLIRYHFSSKELTTLFADSIHEEVKREREYYRLLDLYFKRDLERELESQEESPYEKYELMYG